MKWLKGILRALYIGLNIRNTRIKCEGNLFWPEVLHNNSWIRPLPYSPFPDLDSAKSYIDKFIIEERDRLAIEYDTQPKYITYP